MMRVNRPPNEESYEQRGCGKHSNQYGSAHCCLHVSYSTWRLSDTAQSVFSPRSVKAEGGAGSCGVAGRCP